MSMRRRLLSFFSILVITTMLFSGLSLPSASAQGPDGVERQLNAQTGKVSFISPGDGQALPAADALGDARPPQDPAMALARRFGPEFGLKDPQSDLQELTSARAQDGRLTVRYQQHYQGIPVIGGELIVNTNDNGDLYSMNGEVSPGLSLSTQPAIDPTAARQTALQATAKWYEKSAQDFVASEPELWIFDESLLQPSNRPTELVWRMEVTPKDASMPVRELVLVNAQSGGISLHFNQVDTAWHMPERAPLERATKNNSNGDHMPALLGATWYVATTGNDANSCSSSGSPCGTINGAIGKATEGDTIKIAIGTYIGTGAEVVLINKSVTLSGGWNSAFTTQSGWSTIDGQGGRRGVTSTGANVAIDRFSIQNGFHENQGGGLRNDGGPLTLSNSVVSGNVSHWMGGGIFNYGTLTINSTTISNNSAGQSGTGGGGGGAGIENYYGTVTLNNSTVNNNTILGGYSGSGINTSGDLVLNNSTVSSNTGGGGEGIYTFVGTITSNNSTIAFNGSYGFESQAGTVNLKNTIIASNGAGRDCYNDTSYSGTVTSQGHNLIGNGSICALTATSGDQIGSDANPINPRLTPLLEISETALIHALLPSSPAIDAANLAGCPATDQRGVARPVGGGCDIGAVEYRSTGTVPAYILVYEGSPQNIQINSPASSPLGAVVLDQNGDSVSNTDVTFTGPGSGASAIFTDTGTNTATVVTDANGIATATLSANNMGGTYTVTAAVNGLASTADFQLKNIDTINPASISVVSGSNQVAPLQGQFSQPLKAKVRNSLGQPLSGKIVTFTAPASGASGTFANTHTNVSTAVTDANGIATSPALTANNVRGGYTVKATVSGVVSSANFQLFNGVQTVKTYTAKNGISLPGTLLCTQTKPNCTNNVDPHADAAHRYAIGTSQLYALQHGRNSIDNRGMPIISTVHFYYGYANAFWTGQQMVYGDAYGFPRADDVVAHELTHGVTQYESNLFYYYQSGAINESFSDLWGEYYDQTNGKGNDGSSVKWLMGEDVSGLGAIRSMSDPTWFGDPDSMSSPYYYEGDADNGGVHSNSGVNNKAVYLMVDGGSFNGKTMTALGWTKTAAIYYEANSKLLSSGADYSDLYYALQKACSNLVGQKGITTSDCVAVKDALDAVQMNGQPATNFNTDAPLCAAGSLPKMIFADDLEKGTSKWTFKNGAYSRWQLDSVYGPYAQSGNHSLYADDYPDTITDAMAKLAPITIPQNAYLHFAHAYGFETGYYSGAIRNFDGGVLEYSTNGGVTWVDAGSLINFNGYKGKVYTGSGNPLSGRSAFVGDSHGYISTRLNLSSLAGKKVSFRWRMGLDVFVYDWGWWVDNVKVYTCNPAPVAFNKTAPSNGSVGVGLSTTLSWNSSTYATSYQYCYDLIDDNKCNRTWVTVTSPSVTISSLGANTTYYWQVRASNQVATVYANNQSWGSFTTTSTLPAGTADFETVINGTLQGKYSLGSGLGLHESYPALNRGPVMIQSVNSVPMIASERVMYKVNNAVASFTEMMAMPASQLDTMYWLPWYNNKDLNTQLRFANVSDTDATIHVWIGGVEMAGSPYILPPGASKRLSYAGVDKGPVKIVSDVNIVAAERVIYNVNGVDTSYSEMMALPNKQLDKIYWLPWYNNKDLNSQLRFANVSDTNATVHVSIGGVEMAGSPFILGPGASKRLSFPGIDKGPVKIESDVNIVASERVIYNVNGVDTSFTETMAVPAGQLDTLYWLPWYNNKDLDTQLRFANVSDQTATVSVTIGGVEMVGSPFTLAPGASKRLSFPGIDQGPVKIESDIPIVAAERLIYKAAGGVPTSFSEMMGLPDKALDTVYWLPWYNNVELNTQLRFAVP